MRKVSPEQMAEWIERFHNEIVPYMCMHHMTLHEAITQFKEEGNEWDEVLTGLWFTTMGKEYLRSFMRRHRQRLSPEALEKIKKDEEWIKNLPKTT